MSVARDTSFPVTARDLTATSTSSQTWPSFTTPSTNRMVVAMFLGNTPTATAINGLTSPNLTWTKRLGVVDAGNNYRVEIWTAFAASVVTGEVITHTYGTPSIYTRFSQIIWSFSGSDSSGAGNTASNITMTTLPTLSVTAAGAGSYVLVGLPYRSAGNDIVLSGSDTSEYTTATGGGFGFAEAAASVVSSGAGSTTVSWTSGDVPFAGPTIGGIEIKPAAGATIQTPYNPWPQRAPMLAS